MSRLKGLAFPLPEGSVCSLACRPGSPRSASPLARVEQQQRRGLGVSRATAGHNMGHEQRGVAPALPGKHKARGILPKGQLLGMSSPVGSLGGAEGVGESFASLAVKDGEKGVVLQLDEGLPGEGLLLDSDGTLTDEDYRAVDFLGDADLQAVVQDIAVIERQSETVAVQMTEHARLLAEASKRLRARAQATRLESAKLKKLARMQQAEEARRREELQANRARLEEEARRQQQQQQELLAQRAEQDKKLLELQLLQKERRQREGQDEQVEDTPGSTKSRRQQQEETNGVAVQSVVTSNGSQNGAAGAGPLGAAVLPFAFPNGKHSGNGLDSALAHGPAVDGVDALHVLEEGSETPPVTVKSEEAVAAGNGASAGTLLEDSESTQVNGSVDKSVNVSESMECVIAHPGAMSCTKTTVKKDLKNRVAVVSMETTVKCTGDGCHVGSLDVDDFAALAMSTLADTAHELKHSRRFQGSPDADPRVQERRKEIVELLQEGEVVECSAMEPPSKFGHESFIVNLRSKRTGNEIKAMFKPRVEGDADGWHRAPVEWVAYELNLLLGMDYIPPVAYRTGGVDLGCSKTYKEGAFIYWVPNAKELRKVPATNWGVSVARLLSDTRILDILLNNSDRHHGHFLFGEHWSDGRKRVVLIDHAAGFRKEASVLMEHENAFQTGPVRCVSAHTYLRLRFLDLAMVRDKFAGMLSPEEVLGLLERKEQVLAYLDQLVQERGYHRTVVE